MVPLASMSHEAALQLPGGAQVSSTDSPVESSASLLTHVVAGRATPLSCRPPWRAASHPGSWLLPRQATHDKEKEGIFYNLIPIGHLIPSVIFEFLGASPAHTHTVWRC